MTDGRHDVAISLKLSSSLPGGLGVNTNAGLLPGEQIRWEAHTNAGEAAVLTDQRLLLVRAGFSTAGLGKVNAFPFAEIVDVVFQEFGLVKKLRVLNGGAPNPAFELNVGSQSKEIEATRRLIELFSQVKPVTGTVTKANYSLVHNRTKLPGKLGEAIEATLRPDEQVLRELHSTGEGLVVTSDRVLIVKGGSAAQAMFGQKVKSYPFDAITSIEVSAGALIGRIQITVPGSHEGAGRSAGPGVTAQMENVVQISRPMLPQAREIANFIEGKVAAAKRPTVVVAQVPASASTPAAPSLVEQIKELALLRDAGVLTSDEFDAAKAKLLQS